MRRLVWVPKEGLPLLGSLPKSLEVQPIPDDPAADERLGDVEFLTLPWNTDFSAHFPSMTSLEVVQTFAVGVDGVVGSVPPHVQLCSARGAGDFSVAEWAVGAILSSQREFPFFSNEQREGRWTRRVGLILARQRVLLLGYGSIAKALEARLAPFEVQLSRVARRPREGVFGLDSLDELLPNTDILVALLPLTDATEGLVGAHVLSLLPDNALVVNVARGAIVDIDALTSEVTSGRLRAALDVTVPEPLPSEHPLWRAPGAFITPHVAMVTDDLLNSVALVVTEQLRRFANGEALLNVVEDGY